MLHRGPLVSLGTSAGSAWRSHRGRRQPSTLRLPPARPRLRHGLSGRRLRPSRCPVARPRCTAPAPRRTRARDDLLAPPGSRSSPSRTTSGTCTPPRGRSRTLIDVLVCPTRCRSRSRSCDFTRPYPTRRGYECGRQWIKEGLVVVAEGAKARPSTCAAAPARGRCGSGWSKISRRRGKPASVVADARPVGGAWRGRPQRR